MAANSKRYLMIAESVETAVVRHSRPTFRRIYCPFCGATTDLFRREGDETPADGSHTLRCGHTREPIADGDECVRSNGD